jgi:glycerol-3-phosphate dehydrogenase (NAD(P)+)
MLEYSKEDAGFPAKKMDISVIGAGSWGTAVSWLLGNKGHAVRLWVHDEATASAINKTHRNPRYLSEVDLVRVSATSSYKEALAGAEAVIMVTPSAYVREIACAIAPYVGDDVPLIMLSKGVEADSGLLLTEVLEEVLGNPTRIAALSGPNHAEEVSLGVPSATVIASSNIACAEYFRDVFMTPEFRVYTSTDVCGVELCAASKNIIAIACGIASGVGYGDNTAAMLMTRGLAEMSRLTSALGGDPLTCMGLAGMGDLIATCTSVHSRNRTLGAMIAQGQSLDDFTAKTHMVAEGAIAARTVTALARKSGVELPIADMVCDLLWNGRDLKSVVDELLSRSPKHELAGLDGGAY